MRWILTLVVCVVGAAALMYVRVKRAHSISADALLEMENTDVLVLDVRTKKEYRRGHIKGAMNISHRKLHRRMDRIAGHREKPIVICCEMGPRALFAMKLLEKKGFTDLKCLEGHMSRWRRNGHPVEQSTP